MKNALLVFMLLTVSALPAQTSPAEPYLWAVNKKISASTYGYSISLAPDNAAFVSGPFIGPYYNPDSTDRGGFIAKYDADGSLMWHKEFYSAFGAIRTINAADNAGNVFVSGAFAGNMQFENSMFSPTGLFLLKYDPNGNLLFSLNEPHARAQVICIDPSNNIYLAGDFNTDVDSSYQSFSIHKDCFIAKYDQNGVLLWAKDFFYPATTGNVFDMVLDNAGNIYTTASFTEFDDTHITDSIQLINTGATDGFIAKYNNNAELQWVNTIKGTGGEVPTGIDIDSNGEIFIGGYYSSNSNYYTHIFDSITINGDVNSKAEIFIAKYSTSGICEWVRTAGGNGANFTREIYSDNNGDVFITGSLGSYGDSAVFGNQTFHFPHGQIVMFLAQYDTNGNLKRAEASQGGQGQAFDLTGNAQGDLYITGGFLGNWNFGDLALTGNEDMFLMKLHYNPVVTSTSIVNAKSIEGMQVFPNPTSGMLQLIYSSDVQSAIQLTITNAIGVKVYSEKIAQQQKELVRDIDLGKAAKGIYTIEIIADRKREVRKVVLN